MTQLLAFSFLPALYAFDRVCDCVNWNSRLTAWAERSPSSPLCSISRSSPSGSTKLTRHGPTVSAVTSKSSPEIIALSPIISPGSTIFRTSTLPFLRSGGQFDFAGAEHKCPAGHLTFYEKPKENNTVSALLLPADCG